MDDNILHETASFPNEKSLKFFHLTNALSNLTKVARWVVSRSDGVPYHPVTQQKSSSTDPATWVKWEVAERYCDGNSSYLPAIALKDSDLCVIDLDHVRTDSGFIEPWALEIVESLKSYTEISRSGHGLHIVCRGKKPGRACRRGQFEIYDGGDAKFMTLTGNVIENFMTILAVPDEVLAQIYLKYLPDEKESTAYTGPKSPPLMEQQVIELCSKAKNKDKFEKLFLKGDLSDYNHDDSAADFALVNILSFYTQDSEQIFKIFERSALYKREGRAEKWERPNYRENTINGALARLKDTWQPSQKREAASGPVGSWEEPVRLEFGESMDISFPLDSLPELMQEAVKEVERSVQVHPAMAMVPVLGIAALQIGKKITVVEKKGLEHHPSLFLVCVMDQVERKSETNKRIIDPIRDAMEDEIEEYEKKKAVVEAHNEAIKEQIAAVKKLIREGSESNKETKMTLEQPKKALEELILSKKKLPAHPKNWGDDVTPARLQQNLHIHEGVYGLLSSEGRAIFHRILDQGNQEDSAGKSIYTAATWGDTIGRSRVGKGGNEEAEEVEVRHPALTIMTFIQMDMWKTFAGDKTMRANGTISRICIVNPPSRAGTRLEHENDEPFRPERIAPFTEAIMRIRKWKPEKSVCLELAPEAARARRDFYNAIEKELGPGGQYEDVRDIAGRACSLTARIAGIFAVVDAARKGELGATLPPITEMQWLKAQALEEYFLAQAIDFQRIKGRTGSDHLLEKGARWLLKQLKSGKSAVLLSEMRRGIRGVDDDSTETALINSLEKMGWVRKGKAIKSNVFRYEINQKIAAFGEALDAQN